MNLLTAPNPYVELAPAIVAPRADELFSGCSLFAAFGGAGAFRDPGYAARAEYAFFTHHTYVFELIGLQLLGEITAGLRSHSSICAMAAQTIDEARHVQAYGYVLATLGFQHDAAQLSNLLYDSLVRAGTLEEKLVRAFIVLESLAMGLFSARAQLFSHTSVARLDRRILHEESLHQTNGIGVVADFVRDGRLTLADVTEVTRNMIDDVSDLLSPAELLADVGLAGDPREVSALRGVGVLGTQRSVTRRCIAHALRRLRHQVEAV